jgi:hypothetical protein
MKKREQMSDYNPNEPVLFPLTDGTHATITRLAKMNLEDGYDAYQGRMKKGADKKAVVVVSVRRYDSGARNAETAYEGYWRGQEVRAARQRDVEGRVELPLRDLLAAFTYKINSEDASQKYVLIDGDPRHLMPGNIRLTEREEPVVSLGRAPHKKKSAKPRPDGALSAETCIVLLEEMNQPQELEKFSILVAIGVAIGTADKLEKIREIVAELNLSLLEQITMGSYTGIEGARGEEEQRVHFVTWVKNSARRQFRARLAGTGDIERQKVAGKMQDDFLIERDRYGRRVSPHSGADAQLVSPSTKLLNRERKVAGIALVEVPDKFH